MARLTAATVAVVAALSAVGCVGSEGDGGEGYRVTAPAGDPVSCGAPETVASDPAGDVLWRDVGISPRAVVHALPELAEIDVTSAALSIDGSTLCAAVAMASAPEVDFEVAISLKDATTTHCCAALAFRSTDGVLEVGVPRLYRLDELSPVADAGAELRDATLVFTGTLHEAEWHPRPPRSQDDVLWRLDTRYAPAAEGPHYNDWLPQYESVDQLYVRHRDGRLVLGP